MLSSVLHSETAIQTNISVMRAFVQVREYLMTISSLSAELRELKAKVDLIQLKQEKILVHDIDNLYMAIGQLAARLDEKKNEPRKRIGF